MEIDKKHIKTIKTQFGKMKTKEDLLALLNYAKVVLYAEKAIPFSLDQLNYHYTPKANRKRYIQFTVKKKSGAERVISAPNNGLKEIQKCLNLVFQLVYQPNPAASGFVPGKSIVDNALVHAGSFYVYNIDLKDFFPSIDQARVWGRLKKPPFNLNETQKRINLANIIASLCSHEMEVERMDGTGAFVKVIKSVLPQGAPTSPTLSNIICERLDIRLSGVAKKFGLKYSRYADDITFSSMHNVYQKDSEFLIEVSRIVTDQKFHIKESKTRLQKHGFRQEVTGLIVNEKVNVNKRYVSQLRMWIHRWEIFGYERAAKYFLLDYSNSNKLDNKSIIDSKRLDRWNVKEFTFRQGEIQKRKSKMENVLAGKLEYLKMVKGEKNPVYLALAERMEKLSSQANHLNEVLFIWEKQDIEKAMEYYYSMGKSNRTQYSQTEVTLSKKPKLSIDLDNTFQEMGKCMTEDEIIHKYCNSSEIVDEDMPSEQDMKDLFAAENNMENKQKMPLSEVKFYSDLKKYYGFDKLVFSVNKNNINPSKWLVSNFNGIKFVILAEHLEKLKDENTVIQKNVNTWVITGFTKIIVFSV
jgi:RNA-directed DNA polymerase